jgi:UDP-N-acetylglucosamine 2-epimerase (non-hydrolysing)
MTKKILVVFGTRPEAIKMAPVVKALQRRPEQFETQVCVTAQHRDMLDQVLDIFGIKPDFDLDLMRDGQDLEDITVRVMQGMKDILRREKPDMVLVHGDTTTSFTTSLTCFYEKIPVGHVEAGLRTGTLDAPWPEEMNRRVTGILAYLHFAPTQEARDNLLRSGVESKNIFITGNTVIDALMETVDSIRSNKQLEKSLHDRFPFLCEDRKMILITAHRRESFGEKFEQICLALKKIALRDDVDLVYPVHLNPNVQEPVRRILGNVPNVYLMEPVDYLGFIYLLDKSYLVITDSGGIQEEAPSLGKPVLVLRDATERPEAVDAGTVKLVGSAKETIVREANHLLDSKESYERMAQAINPFGDGSASERIIQELLTTK